MLWFVLGVVLGWASMLIWLAWDSITERMRSAGLTPAELRRSIAWDGPWTDGFRWTSYGTAECRMEYRSKTGRRLVSYGNKHSDVNISTVGTAVFS